MVKIRQNQQIFQRQAWSVWQYTRRALHADAGAVIIEFALVALLLVLLVAGIVDASEAFRIKHVLWVTAREGARAASTTSGLLGGGGTSVAETDAPQVYATMDQILNNAHLQVTAARTRNVSFPNGKGPGQPIQATVTYDYVPIVGIVPSLGPVKLKSASTMRYESS